MPLGYDYIIKCLMIMSMIGMSIKIFFGNDKSTEGDYGSANSTIWGFGLVASSIITLMFVAYSIQTKFSKVKKGVEAVKFGTFISEFFSQSMPSLITVIILLWVITLNMTFYKRINQGNVADEYFSLTSGSSFLFTFQVICLFLYLNEYIRSQIDSVKNPGAENALSRIKFAVYFIAIINLMITGMMTIILYLFSTDG